MEEFSVYIWTINFALLPQQIKSMHKAETCIHALHQMHMKYNGNYHIVKTVQELSPNNAFSFEHSVLTKLSPVNFNIMHNNASTTFKNYFNARKLSW